MAAKGRIPNEPSDVKTQCKFVQATPTIDTNAYSANDRLGSIMEFEVARYYPNGAAVLSNVIILDKAKQSKALYLYLFNASPTVAGADNAALNIADGEMNKCIGVISIEAADYNTANTGSSIATVGVEKTKGLVLESASLEDGKIYGLLVAGESVTYGAASDLVVGLGVLQD